MNLLVFAFQNNISETVLQKLDTPHKRSIASDNSHIRTFLSELIETNPQYILGLGMYSGRDRNKLRIETVCKDKGKSRYINYFLNPANHSKLAQGIGNSYCNLVSLLIMEAIDKGALTSKYTFIHIPKSFQSNLAVSEINKMLVDYIGLK